MRQSLTLLLAIVALSAAAIGPSAAQAACSQWDITNMSGPQSNGWGLWLSTPYMGQSGSTLYGNAFTSPGGGKPGMWGGITGSVAGSHVSFSVAWQNGAAGIYDGWIDQWGFVSGTTYDKCHPQYKAGWHFSQRARCVR